MLKNIKLVWVLILCAFILCPGNILGKTETFSSQSWHYVCLSGNEDKEIQNFEIKPETVNHEDFWVVHGEIDWRDFIPGLAIANFQQLITVKLKNDFTLYSFESDTLRNNFNVQKRSIQYLGDRYEVNNTWVDRTQKGTIPVKQPVYYLDLNCPWTLAILLKSQSVKPNDFCTVFTSSDQIKTVYMTMLRKTGDNLSLNCNLDNNAQILVRLVDNAVLEIGTVTQKIQLRDRVPSIDSLQPYTEGLSTKADIRAPYMVTDMRVKIKLWLDYQKGTEYLTNERQIFKGNINPVKKYIDGEIEVTAKRNKVNDPLLFPMKEHWELALNKYLGQSLKVDPTNPNIIQMAQSITRDSHDIWGATRAIAAWVGEHTTYDINTNDIYNAKDDVQTLRTGLGRCFQFSALTVSLCRAVHIPARIVSGLVYDRGLGNPYFAGHAWVEVYMGSINQWVTIDPTFKQLDMVDATHIGLVEENDMYLAGEIEVLDFETLKSIY